MLDCAQEKLHAFLFLSKDYTFLISTWLDNKACVNVQILISYVPVICTATNRSYVAGYCCYY